VIVVDASVLANAVGDDAAAGRQSRELLRVHRELALRANVPSYDACYVALAEALEWRLCTVDGRLARASSSRCAMQLITPPD